MGNSLYNLYLHSEYIKMLLRLPLRGTRQIIRDAAKVTLGLQKRNAIIIIIIALIAVLICFFDRARISFHLALEPLFKPCNWQHQAVHLLNNEPRHAGSPSASCATTSSRPSVADIGAVSEEVSVGIPRGRPNHLHMYAT
jgi:hypothetical protein